VRSLSKLTQRVRAESSLVPEFRLSTTILSHQIKTVKHVAQLLLSQCWPFFPLSLHDVTDSIFQQWLQQGLPSRDLLPL
jgi:hypothetical protein